MNISRNQENRENSTQDVRLIEKQQTQHGCQQPASQRSHNNTTKNRTNS